MTIFNFTHYFCTRLSQVACINSVLNSVDGLMAMRYDVVNRSEERSLPNGVKTSYEYDDLDRVKKIMHMNTVINQVLSSVTYDRE
jgi:hypothetical protein